MAHDYPGPFKFQNGTMLCFRPQEKDYIPVYDARKELNSEKCPRDNKQALDFYQRRIRLIESAEIAADEKKYLLQSLESRLESSSTADSLEFAKSPRLLFSGNAYAAFYNRNSLSFTDSTALFYDLTSVVNVGDANKQLYLTASNRSRHGVEVLLYYINNDGSRLAIVDWGIDYGKMVWALCLPHEALSDYVKKRDFEGHQYETMSVVNSTRRSSKPKWTNEVLLYNEKTQRYDLIYGSEYELDPSQEGHYLFWGPMIEVADFPYTTREIGFFDVYIMQDSRISQLLTQDVAHIVADCPPPAGNLILKENYSFVAHW